MLELTAAVFVSLLSTAKASVTESNEGGLKGRSSSRESSRQIVSDAGMQLEFMEVPMGVTEPGVVTRVEVTSGVEVFCSFFGLESFTLGLGARITFFFAVAEVRCL